MRPLFRHNTFFEHSGPFLLLGLLALVLIMLDNNTSILQPLRHKVTSYMLGAYSLANGANSEFSQGFTAQHTRSKLLTEIDRLQRQSEELLVQQGLELRQLARENKQLRDLLNLADVHSEGIIVAEQIRSPSSNSKSKAYINVGSKDRVRLSQPVLGARGLVGQIDQLFDDYSQILPITHPSHALSVQVRDKATRFIAQGNGSGLVIHNLPQRANIQIGDNLVTTGLGGIYPQLYQVGKVSAIKDLKNGRKDVFITPHINFSELRFVVVVYQHRFSLQLP